MTRNADVNINGCSLTKFFTEPCYKPSLESCDIPKKLRPISSAVSGFNGDKPTSQMIHGENKNCENLCTLMINDH